MGKQEIINLALSLLGSSASTVSSISINSTKLESVAEKWYDQIRRVSLIEVMPNFAIERRVVSKLSTSPSFGYKHSYSRPADMLRMLGIGEADNLFEEFNDEGGTIDTDVDNGSGLQIRMIVDEDDMSKADPAFINYFAAKLALYLAPTVTSDENKRAVMDRFMRQEMNRASALQAQNNPPIRISRRRFDEARRFGTSIGRRKK